MTTDFEPQKTCDLDVRVWDQLLGRYVRAGRVAYATWQNRDQEPLAAWILAQSQVNHGELTPDQALAFWINLYNALTIQAVLDQYPIASIFPKVLGIPDFIQFLRFFQKPRWRSGDRTYSLNQIEHGILRPHYPDTRLHFALVCASVGCPWLRSQAYTPERVQSQLSEEADRFIHNPSKVLYDPTRHQLHLSPIFRWYRRDFEAAAGSVIAYLQPYLQLPGTSLQTLSIRYLPYDWGLNQRIS